MAARNEKIWQLSADGEAWEMRPEVAQKYRAASQRQLKDWVDGKATHTDELKAEGLEELVECCPDFSCCGVKMWDKNVREAFASANDETRSQMCMMSLSGLSELPEDVYVAGTDQTMH